MSERVTTRRVCASGSPVGDDGVCVEHGERACVVTQHTEVMGDDTGRARRDWLLAGKVGVVCLGLGFVLGIQAAQPDGPVAAETDSGTGLSRVDGSAGHIPSAASLIAHTVDRALYANRTKAQRIRAVRDKARAMVRAADNGRVAASLPAGVYSYSDTQRRTINRYRLHVVNPRTSYVKPRAMWRFHKSSLHTGTHRTAKGEQRRYWWRRVWFTGQQHSILGGDAYSTRYEIEWRWHKRGGIYSVRKDWDFKFQDAIAYKQDSGYRDEDSHMVANSHRTIYRVDTQRKVNNCILNYGCVLGSNYPTVIGTVWAGGLYSLRATAFGK